MVLAVFSRGLSLEAASLATVRVPQYQQLVWQVRRS